MSYKQSLFMFENTDTSCESCNILKYFEYNFIKCQTSNVYIVIVIFHPDKHILNMLIKLIMT